MKLYSGINCVQSHSCRIVLFDKDVECDIVYVDPASANEDLALANPYNETPTLVDRDLTLYGSQIINEYLDERLPHPPLMPVDPVSRGRARLMIQRLQRDWLSQLIVDDEGRIDLDNTTTSEVRDGLIAISPIFSDQPFLLGEEYSLVDSFLLPLLWRLPALKINLPKQAKPLSEYADRLFERDSFKASLNDLELELR